MQRGLIVLLLVLGFTTFSLAQDIGLNSITGKAGVIMPEDPWDTGFFLGASANLGEVYENITLVPTVEYWLSSYEQSIIEADLSNFKIGVAGHYNITDIEGLYVGAGLAINFLSLEVTTPSYTVFDITVPENTTSSSDTEFGATILAGYKVAVAGQQGVVELGYNLMDLGTFQIGFGIEFDMNK